MTLNSFLVARWTSTFLPLGAPAISSTAHCPSTVVQPSTPFVSKSNVSVGALSGTLSSSAAAAPGNRGHGAPAASAANVVLSIPRRVTFMGVLSPLLIRALSLQCLLLQTTDAGSAWAAGASTESASAFVPRSVTLDTGPVKRYTLTEFSHAQGAVRPTRGSRFPPQAGMGLREIGGHDLATTPRALFVTAVPDLDGDSRQG